MPKLKQIKLKKGEKCYRSPAEYEFIHCERTGRVDCIKCLELNLNGHGVGGHEHWLDEEGEFLSDATRFFPTWAK